MSKGSRCCSSPVGRVMHRSDRQRMMIPLHLPAELDLSSAIGAPHELYCIGVGLARHGDRVFLRVTDIAAVAESIGCDRFTGGRRAFPGIVVAERFRGQEQGTRHDFDGRYSSKCPPDQTMPD